MEKKVVQLEIGKIFAVIIAIVVVAIIAAMVLQGGYFKGDLVTDKESPTTEALIVLGSESMIRIHGYGNDLMRGQMEVVNTAVKTLEIELMRLKQEKAAIALGKRATDYGIAIEGGKTHAVASKYLMGLTARDLGIEDKAIVIAIEEMQTGIEKGVNIELMNFSKLANNELTVLAKNTATAGLSHLAEEITLTANKVLDFTYGMALTINTNVVADEIEWQFQTVGISELSFNVEQIALPRYEVLVDAQQFNAITTESDYVEAITINTDTLTDSDYVEAITINTDAITTDSDYVETNTLLDIQSLDSKLTIEKEVLKY